MNMRISKVDIQNFKAYKQQSFNFGNPKMILLTGSNGFGKTTIIDAIEWCLTGTISRLKSSYETRNTTQTEKNRQQNKRGVIKNYLCNDSDTIKVTLTFNVNGTEFSVFREQQEDSIFINSELRFSDDIPSEIRDKILSHAANENFYKFHVCDNDKAFRFFNSSRQDVKGLFDDFIRDFQKVDKFLENASLYLSEKKLELESSKGIYTKLKDDLERRELELSEIKVTENIIQYPQVLFYPEEVTCIETLNINLINSQYAGLREVGFANAKKIIDQYVEITNVKDRISDVNKMLEFENSNKESVNFFIAHQLHTLDWKGSLEAKINYIQQEISRFINYKVLSDLNISESNLYSDIYEKMSSKLTQINQFSDQLNAKQSQLNEAQKGNEIVTALSSLITNRAAFLEYKKNGNENCPLCGSTESFKQINSGEAIASEAEEYIRKTSLKISELSVEINSDNTSLMYSIEKYILEVTEFLSSKLKVYKAQLNSYTEAYISCQSFLELANKVSIPINSNIVECLVKEKATLNQRENSSPTFKSLEEQITNLLIILGHDTEIDFFSKSKMKFLQAELAQLSGNKQILENFDKNDLQRKLISLKNLAQNTKIQEIEKEINEITEKQQDAEKKRDMIENEITRLKEYILNVGRAKTQIETSDLNTVGPYMYKIFTKVIKHSDISEFNFSRDRSQNGGGAVFTDQNGNNILNILSQGQLGVFLISIFLANAFKRKSETEFKTYFLDDVTGCLDDMNILTFVDIIKYQLSTDQGAIDQFFFATCDSNLENLLTHKMESFDINCLNIHFSSNTKGTLSQGKEGVEYFG